MKYTPASFIPDHSLRLHQKSKITSSNDFFFSFIGSHGIAVLMHISRRKYAVNSSENGTNNVIRDLEPLTQVALLT